MRLCCQQPVIPHPAHVPYILDLSLPGRSGIRVAECLSVVIGITNWQGSISPVFDVSANLCIVEIHDGAAANRRNIFLKSQEPFGKAREIKEQGVELLMCGAISRRFEYALVSNGIRVISFICGNIEHIIKDFVKGNALDNNFLMPGSYGKGRRYRYRKGHGK